MDEQFCAIKLLFLSFDLFLVMNPFWSVDPGISFFVAVHVLRGWGRGWVGRYAHQRLRKACPVNQGVLGMDLVYSCFSFVVSV